MDQDQLIRFLLWQEDLHREEGLHALADDLGIAAMLAAHGASGEALAATLPEWVALEIAG